MIDEKELVKRIKNSLRAGKSRAEILRGFEKEGYRLEYGEKLIEKAKRRKRIFYVAVFSILILIFLMVISYYPFFSSAEKEKMDNPLLSGTSFSANLNNSEITPEYISFLLNDAGAWQLRKNPITLEPPIINFKIGQQNFYSEVVDGKIKTFVGLSDNADIEFSADKEIVVQAIESKNSGEILKEEIANKKISFEIKASEPELLAKGYLQFYNSLK